MLALLPACLAACAVPLPRYQFEPKPVVVKVVESRQSEVQTGRILLSVMEIVRAPNGRELELWVRLRTENYAGTLLRVDMAQLLLVSADLRPFGLPRIYTAAEPAVEAGQTRAVDLYFPLPEGCGPRHIDFSTLSFRCHFETGAGEQVVSLKVHGQRIYRPTYHPVYVDYWFPAYYYGY